MNVPLTWRDPVVAEIHAIRDELARQFDGDMAAYSRAAVAQCQRLNLQFAALPKSPFDISAVGNGKSSSTQQ